MASLHCVVVTPEKTELDIEALSIIVPLFDGEIGILPGRAPMIGRLGFGIMKIKTSSGETTRYVDGGFLQVTRDGVYILTDRLMAPSAIDRSQAEADLKAANALQANSPAMFAIRDRAVAQARAKLRLASN